MGVLNNSEKEVTKEGAKSILREGDNTLRSTAKPTVVDLISASTITSTSYGAISWVELDGESQVGFTMKVTGLEDASGNTPAAKADFAWYLAFGSSAQTSISDDDAIRTGTWSSGSDPEVFTDEKDYQLSCLANAYDNGNRVFTADAKRIGIAVKKAGTSAGDPVVSVSAFKF